MDRAHNFKDLAGQRIGRWLVLRASKDVVKGRDGETFFGTSLFRAARWDCQCECGIIRTVGGEKLRQGNSQSCGCISASDLTGKRFGTWSVIRAVRDHEGRLRWLCKCSKSGWEGLFEPRELLFKQPPATPGKTEMPGAWERVASPGKVLGSPGEQWIVAKGIKDKIICRCKKSGWIVLFSKQEAAHPEKLPCPAEWTEYRPPRAEDMSGKIFGQWTAVRRVGVNKHRLAIWECKCGLCGKLKKMPSATLRRGPGCRCPDRTERLANVQAKKEV